MNTSARPNALSLRLSQRQSGEQTLLVLALENTLAEPLDASDASSGHAALPNVIENSAEATVSGRWLTAAT